MTEEPYPDIRIIDFGFAKNVRPGEQICLIVGTPDYVGKCNMECRNTQLPRLKEFYLFIGIQYMSGIPGFSKIFIL